MILRLLDTVEIDCLQLPQVTEAKEMFVQLGEPPEKSQNYIKDVRLMRRGPLEDEGISFQRRSPGTRAAASGQEPAA